MYVLRARNCYIGFHLIKLTVIKKIFLITGNSFKLNKTLKNQSRRLFFFFIVITRAGAKVSDHCHTLPHGEWHTKQPVVASANQK